MLSHTGYIYLGRAQHMYFINKTCILRYLDHTFVHTVWLHCSQTSAVEEGLFCMQAEWWHTFTLTDCSAYLNDAKPYMNTPERCMLWYYDGTSIFKTVNGLFYGIQAFTWGISWITHIYSRGFNCKSLLISWVSICPLILLSHSFNLQPMCGVLF